MNKYKVFNRLFSFLPPHKRENLVNWLRTPYSKEEDFFKVIYIHVPKAGGKAISFGLLGSANGTGHQKLRWYERTPEKFSKYFKFTFVRNPWDRIVSAYHYMEQIGFESNDKEFFDKYIKGLGFESFILALRDDRYWNLIRQWEHFTPQVDFLRNSKGNIGMDFVGKLENIEVEFQYLANKINPSAVLEVKNKSLRDDYKSYFTPEMIEIVRIRYQEDIEEFSYEY